MQPPVHLRLLCCLIGDLTSNPRFFYFDQIMTSDLVLSTFGSDLPGEAPSGPAPRQDRRQRLVKRYEMTLFVQSMPGSRSLRKLTGKPIDKLEAFS